MRRLLGLACAIVLVVAVRTTLPSEEGSSAAAVMALGFVLIVSFLFGQAVSHVGLPAISGYLLVGMMFGPYILGAVSPVFAVLGRDSITALRLIDNVALGMIALAAGGELKLFQLRAHGKTIGGVIFAQGVLVFAGITVGVVALRWAFPSLAGLTPAAGWAAAILFGVIALANSPATVLAIVQECRAKGAATEVVIAVTVVKDVVVISLFTVALALAAPLAGASGGMSGEVLARLGWEVAGSIGAGVLLGWLVAQYMNRLGHEAPLLVLAIAFAAVTLLPAMHLSGILACMVAGYYIENHSPHGEELIRAIERHALPVYIVFFTLAGADLDWSALAESWRLALFLAGMRLALIILGTALGAKWAGAPDAVIRYGWSGFVAQAGVTLGFAILIDQRLPELGAALKTVTLALIAINQIAGPLLFRWGLRMAGEIPTGNSAANGGEKKKTARSGKA